MNQPSIWRKARDIDMIFWILWPGIIAVWVMVITLIIIDANNGVS